MVRAEEQSLAFGSYHYHLYLYSALVPGERNSNSTPAQSATVGGNYTRHTMNIDDIDFHDSLILSVAENTKEHYLDFLIDFPTNWRDNIFEHRILRFSEVIFYCIDEIPFFGQPTILEIKNLGRVTKSWGTESNHIEATRTKIEIQTNAGNRIIEYGECIFIDNQINNDKKSS